MHTICTQHSTLMHSYGTVQFPLATPKVKTKMELELELELELNGMMRRHLTLIYIFQISSQPYFWKYKRTLQTCKQQTCQDPNVHV